MAEGERGDYFVPLALATSVAHPRSFSWRDMGRLREVWGDIFTRLMGSSLTHSRRFHPTCRWEVRIVSFPPESRRPPLTIASGTSRLIDLSLFARRGDRMGEQSAR